MRIAVDVSPLSHPRTGIGNYLRGMVGGLAAAGGGQHEVFGFAPTSLRGPRPHSCRARRHRRRGAAVAAPLRLMPRGRPGAGSVILPPSASSARSTR